MDSSTSHRTTDFTAQTEIRRQLHKTWKEIEDVKTQIQTAIDEIAKANASLAKLRAVERELHEAAATTASLLTPSMFQHIPADIIGEIAGHLMETNDEYFSASRNSDGPWPLSYICHSWRVAMLSLPQVWSSFRVDFCAAKSTLRLLSTVLERSAHHPLAICLSVAHPEEFLRPTISLLAKHSRRWKDVSLGARTGPRPLFPLRGRLPLLEKLKLDIRADNQAEPWRNSRKEQSIFEDAPKLVELTIEAVPDTQDGDAVDLRFPLHQIQRVYNPLHLDQLGFFSLYDMSHFANVTDLHFDTEADLPSESLTAGMVTLRRVVSFSLQHTSLLLSLLLPSLRSLNITYTEQNDLNDTLSTFLTTHSKQFTNWGLHKLVVHGEFLGYRFANALSHESLENLLTLSCEFATFEYPQDEEWETMIDILALLIWTPPPRTIPKFLSNFSLGFSKYPVNVMPHLRNLILAFSTGCLEYGMFDLLREVVVSRMHLDNEAEAATPLDPLDQAGDLVPARLQDFSIRYTTTGPCVTMKDLDDLVEGKFHALHYF